MNPLTTPSICLPKNKKKKIGHHGFLQQLFCIIKWYVRPRQVWLWLFELQPVVNKIHCCLTGTLLHYKQVVFSHVSLQDVRVWHPFLGNVLSYYVSVLPIAWRQMAKSDHLINPGVYLGCLPSQGRCSDAQTPLTRHCPIAPRYWD